MNSLVCIIWSVSRQAPIHPSWRNQGFLVLAPFVTVNKDLNSYTRISSCRIPGVFCRRKPHPDTAGHMALMPTWAASELQRLFSRFSLSDVSWGKIRSLTEWRKPGWYSRKGLASLQIPPDTSPSYLCGLLSCPEAANQNRCLPAGAF
jgi:hypothetical protein